MSNATSCEVAAFDAIASSLFIYQLAASCSNACLQCQGFLWQERRHRHIWWHCNDYCFVFEDGSPFAFSSTFITHHHVEDWTGRPAGGVYVVCLGNGIGTTNPMFSFVSWLAESVWAMEMWLTGLWSGLCASGDHAVGAMRGVFLPCPHAHHAPSGGPAVVGKEGHSPNTRFVHLSGGRR